jgi:hypothetical protein
VQYFGVGDFELKVIGSKENIDLLPRGTYLVRDFDMTDNGYNNVMIVMNRKIDYDIEKGWILTVSGGSLKTIVGQRIIWSQTNISGSLEEGIRQIITDNIISPTDTNRRIDNFILDEPNGYSDSISAQLLGEKIADWLEETCNSYGIGWDVILRNEKYVFTIKKGTDRTYNQSEVPPVVFSPEFDNLISATYTEDFENYANTALIGGEGEGVQQRTAHIGTAVGLDRYEAYIDGGSVSSNGDIITLEQYIELLKGYGTDQLNNKQMTEKVEGQITPDGVYQVDRDYFLGDLVQIDTGRIEAVSQIIEVIYSEDENGYSMVPTFGSWTK